MFSCYLILFVTVNLLSQTGGQQPKENISQHSENITAPTEPNRNGFVEDHTFKPLRHENGSYPGSVTSFDTTPTITNDNNPVSNPIPDITHMPDRTISQSHPVFNGQQVPAPDHSSATEALAFQWHVGIYSKTFSPYMQICGGTLVTLGAVVSAAHCFWNDVEGVLSATQFAVATGKRYRPWFDTQDKFQQKSDVSAVHIPPRFRGSSTNFQGDIAVVLLTSPFFPTPSVRPACVPLDEEFDKQQLQKGNIGTVLGWGLTEENGRPSPVLNYIELPFVEIDECLSTASLDFMKYITQDKICAGVTTGRALCRGDSGGGWVVQDNSYPPVPYLHGVASTAAKNEHQCNAYALAALTHVFSHRGFLALHIPGLENECQRHYPQIKAKAQRNKDTRTGGKLVPRKGKKKFVCNCYCKNKNTPNR